MTGRFGGIAAAWLGTLMAFGGISHAADLAIKQTRVWPAKDYTRVSFEASAPIKYSVFVVREPDRLVLDLEDVAAGGGLADLGGKITSKDPYVKQVRVGRFKPNVMRLVFDLKADVRPQVFALKPIGEYGHRLVLDVYPSQPPDEMQMLLADKDAAAAATVSTSARRAPAVDAGASMTRGDIRSHARLEAPVPTSAPTSPASVSNAPSAGNELATRDSGLTPRLDTAFGSSADGDARVVSKETASQAEITLPPSAAIIVANPAIAVPTELRAAEKAKPKKDVVKSGRVMTVALDAGHGGEDPGAKGKNGTWEKDVTLAIARKVKAQLDDEPSLRGVLIRDDDYFIPLGMRVAKARRLKVDLFVSIHADAFKKASAHGSSVFSLSERGATSVMARWLAARANEADLIGGVNVDVKDPYLKQTLLDLSQTATNNDSLKLARSVLREIGSVNRLHKESVEQAGFAVLKAPDIPSILVESAFISNPDEERRLADDKYQEKFAAAIVGGIKRYFAKNPPLARTKLASAE